MAKHRHYWKDWVDGMAWCRCGMTLDDFEKTPASIPGRRRAILYHVGLHSQAKCKCGWCKRFNTLIDEMSREGVVT